MARARIPSPRGSSDRYSYGTARSSEGAGLRRNNCAKSTSKISWQPVNMYPGSRQASRRPLPSRNPTMRCSSTAQVAIEASADPGIAPHNSSVPSRPTKRYQVANESTKAPATRAIVPVAPSFRGSAMAGSSAQLDLRARNPPRSVRRSRREEDEQRRRGAGAVRDSVLLAGGRERGLSLAHAPRLRADAHLDRAFEDRVDLVASFVRVRFLLLSGEQTIDVAEEPVALEKRDFLHLRGIETPCRRKALQVDHANLLRMLRPSASARRRQSPLLRLPGNRASDLPPVRGK